MQRNAPDGPQLAVIGPQPLAFYILLPDYGVSLQLILSESLIADQGIGFSRHGSAPDIDRFRTDLGCLFCLLRFSVENELLVD